MRRSGPASGGLLARSSMVLSSVVAVCGAGAGAGAVAGATASVAHRPAAPTTTVPDPPRNIPPCSRTWLKAFDCARKATHVAPLTVDWHALEALPVAEQVFALVNLERTARGLAPVVAMTAQLDAAAQRGALAGEDPTGVDPLTGGATTRSWYGNVGRGYTSGAPLVYHEVYMDGAGKGDDNVDCVAAATAGCWGHRSNFFATGGTCGSGTAALFMGVGFDPAFRLHEERGAIASLMEATCAGSAPADETVTWTKLEVSLSP